MRLLLITQYWPPEPVELPREMAETLQSLGHQVTVLTGLPNWPSGRLYAGYRVRVWQRENRSQVEVIRIPLYPDHSKSPWKRALNLISFAAAATLIAPFSLKKFDLVYFVHPPITLAFPAWLLSVLWRAPLVFEIQDLWPETLCATGMLRSVRLLALVHRFTNWAYRRATAVRVISPGFRTNLVSKNVPPGKIHVISNWVDTETFRPASSDLDLSNELGFESRFTVLYAGTIGLAQRLEVVLDAARFLRDLPQVQFVLMGEGLQAAELQRRCAESNIDNVRILPRRPRGEMAAIFALADVLLVHLRDDPLFRITIPHKVFSYLASGKPVLAAISGDAADIVRATGAGLTCQPDDPGALAALVRRFYLMDPLELQAMGRKARQAASERYNRVHLVKEISKMLQGALEEYRAGHARA